MRVVIPAPAFLRAEYPPSAAPHARQDGLSALRAVADDLGAVVDMFFKHALTPLRLRKSRK